MRSCWALSPACSTLYLISGFTALVLSAAVTFATSPEQIAVIYIIITLVVTHLIDSNVLLPLVVGSKVRISALITELGAIIGKLVWGYPWYVLIHICYSSF